MDPSFHKNGNLEKINSLSDMRANTHLKTKGGTNCLHLAAANGYARHLQVSIILIFI